MKRILAAIGAACVALSAAAAEPEAAVQVPMRGPWVPPQVAQRAVPAAETRGEALRAQVREKLRRRFEAADVAGQGSLSREQARAAGWGLVEQAFDRIDVRREGRLRFDDVLRHLRSRGAEL